MQNKKLALLVVPLWLASSPRAEAKAYFFSRGEDGNAFKSSYINANSGSGSSLPIGQAIPSIGAASAHGGGSEGMDKSGSRQSTPDGIDKSGNQQSTPDGIDKSGNQQSTPDGIDKSGNQQSTPDGIDKSGNQQSTPDGIDKSGNGKGDPNGGSSKDKKAPHGEVAFPEVARVALGDVTPGTDGVAPMQRVASKPNEYLTWVVPGSTIVTPTAFGAQWGEVFAAVGVENRSRFGSVANGTGLLGFGVGDATELVGLEVMLSSYGLWRHGLPFTTGGVSLKLHHYFPELRIAVALGYENAIVWNSPDTGQSFYGVVSQTVLLKDTDTEPFSLLTWHLGIGDGRFRSESDIIANNKTPQPFGAVGLRIVRPLSLVLNWDGSDLGAGISAAPFQRFPLVVGLSALDVTRNAGDGVRWAFTIAWGDDVQRDTFPVDWFQKKQEPAKAAEAPPKEISAPAAAPKTSNE